MADTLEHLIAFLALQATRPKVVIWEHNSHIGDARATEMSDRGEVNVGQLVRERYKNEAVLIGLPRIRAPRRLRQTGIDLLNASA